MVIVIVPTTYVKSDYKRDLIAVGHCATSPVLDMVRQLLDRDARCRYLAVRNLSFSGLSSLTRSEGAEEVLGFLTKPSKRRVTFTSAGAALEDFLQVEEVAYPDHQQAR